MVDALVSGTSGESRGGSSPLLGTSHFSAVLILCAIPAAPHPITARAKMTDAHREASLAELGRPHLLGSSCMAYHVLEDGRLGRPSGNVHLGGTHAEDARHFRYSRHWWWPGSALPRQCRPSRPSMTFFITSVGKGNGADLGGLDGADAHCLALAKAAGSTQHQLARLPEHDRAGRRRRCQRARPHRQGPVAERQGHGGGQERGRPALGLQTTSPSRRR